MRFSTLSSVLCLGLVCGCGDGDPEPSAKPDVADAASDTMESPELSGPEDLEASPEGILPRFDPAGEGFYRTPWPFDARRDGVGHPDLVDFPERSKPAVEYVAGVVQIEVADFSPVPVVYVPFAETLAPVSLPTPAQTLSPQAPVQLLEVSSSGCGRRIPIEVLFEEESAPMRDPNVLMAAPVPGFVLSPGAPHALVVLHSLLADDDHQLTSPESFRAALEGRSADDGLNTAFAPLRACAAEAGLAAADIVIATVFTTQDPPAELRRLVRAVRDPAATPPPVITRWERVEEGSDMGLTTFRGTYETPIYQRGTPPYLVEGGGFRYDAAGAPIIQRWESVAFAVTLPPVGDAPYPVLVFENGAGADLFHHLSDRQWIAKAFEAGYAVVSFEQQFVGSRAVIGGEPGVASILNPEVSRTTVPQQVIDTAFFLELLGGPLSEVDPPPPLDVTRLVFGGQSQSAQVGAIAAGLLPDFAAFVLNGVGGFLSVAIPDRTTPVNPAEAIEVFLQLPSGTVDRFHPISALLQMTGDLADPIHYAPQWIGSTDDPQGTSVFLINGIDDPWMPAAFSGALTVAGDASPVAEPGWEVDPFGVWNREPLQPPIAGNRMDGAGRSVTLASALSPTTGHFTVYAIDALGEASVHFWTTALEGLAEVPAGAAIPPR